MLVGLAKFSLEDECYNVVVVYTYSPNESIKVEYFLHIFRFWLASQNSL